MFDISLSFRALPEMLSGIGITFSLLVLSLAFGFALAVGLLLMRISGRRFLSWLAQTYIYIFRGTPILVQIFIIYYGLPQFELIRESIFWPILRDPFGCTVVALSLNSGAYMAEILRGGVLGVPQGVSEAGEALGLSSSQRFIYLTSPIALRLSLPALGNETISMLKSTALASTITLMDMTGIGRTLMAEYFAPYEIFITLALIYMLLTYVLQIAMARVEHQMGRYTRKEQ